MGTYGHELEIDEKTGKIYLTCSVEFNADNNYNKIEYRRVVNVVNILKGEGWKIETYRTENENRKITSYYWLLKRTFKQLKKGE